MLHLKITNPPDILEDGEVTFSDGLFHLPVISQPENGKPRELVCLEASGDMVALLFGFDFALLRNIKIHITLTGEGLTEFYDILVKRCNLPQEPANVIQV